MNGVCLTNILEHNDPTIQRILNISKETTYRELSRIKGITEEVQRAMGINLTAGPVNAIEIVCNIYKAPTPDELLKAFENSLVAN